MSVMVLMVSVAMAEGTGVWLDGVPDPTQDRALSHVSAADLVADEGWTDVDDRAIAHLASEMEAVQPLLDVFDGELQIMRRLEDALANISAIREEDRDLVYRALLFQGLAVRRYFQDTLSSEPGAAPYRASIGGQVTNRPWIDAVALDPDRQATAAEIPEAPELLLFQELRARHLLAGAAQIVAADLPPGTRLAVNGVPATADRVRVLPGTHRAVLLVNSQISVRVRAVVSTGEVVRLEPVAMQGDVRALVSGMRAGERVLPLSEGTGRTLDAQPQPVYLFATDGRKVLRYEVTGRSAVESGAERTPEEGLSWRAAVGGGWVYDGDYLLLNDGAPADYATVNAGSPVINLGAEVPVGPLVVGAGIDALVPLGEWHSLPSGDLRVRARLYPHAEVGVRSLRLTAGWLFPWHIGVGPRARIVVDPERGIELSAAYVYGIGVPLSYDTGDTFRPDQLQTAWLAVGIRR